MKKQRLKAAILVGIAVIIGCQREEPQAPELIAPEDGAVFDTDPPTFIWSSEEYAYDYVIRIYMGSSTDIQDTLADTTYAMSKNLFETLLNGTYNWAAAAMSEEGELFWSESRSFVIDKPAEPQGLDLDTTYFPFGMGYEWCYEKKKLFSEDSKDTVAVIVVDSFWIDNTLFFKLEGGSFFDVGNSVEIGDGKIKAFDETINLLPEEQSSYLWIRYYGDTLYMFTGDEPYPDYWEDWSVYRIKAIGLIHQIYYWQDVYENTSGGDRYSLLWFYNGQDTVWP